MDREYLIGQARLAARAAGVPEELYLAQIQKESSWNPQAKSSEEAVGLSQITPDTMKTYSIDPDLFGEDPVYQLQAGAEIMGDLYGRFGSWPLALSAYNDGPGRTDLMRNQEDYRPIPRKPETQRYVMGILSQYEPENPLHREGRPRPRPGDPRAIEQRDALARAEASDPNAGRPNELDATTTAREELLRALYFSRGRFEDFDPISQQYLDHTQPRPQKRPMGLLDQ
jgi:hypothetical protein